MKRISLEISGRIDEVPERVMDGDLYGQPSNSLLEAIVTWAERHGALATVMVRLADDATGGDDE